MALSIDVAVMYFNWMTLQKAADAAVFAGAGYLPQMPDAAVTTANGYASANGVHAGEIVSTEVTANNTRISIRVQRSVPYFFGKILGLTSALVSASATALVPGPPSTIGTDGSSTYCGDTGQCGLVPIGLDYTTPYMPGQAVTLNQGQVGPGNWGSLALGGVGGDDLRTNIANGFSGPISINDWIDTEPGKKVGPIDQGFSDRTLAGQLADPTGTFQTHALSDARVIIVPMVDWNNPNGRSQVQVKAFAALWLVGANGGTINAYFITQVVANSTGSATAPNDGAQSLPIVIQ
ncbi:MAG: TadG family pilus assembly protein [Candidatus Binataceae bacterium]